MDIKRRSALIVVDMQNDFLPGGALPVAEGDQIIDGINELARKFYNKDKIVIFSQDWHPEGHASFASSHEGKNPGNPIEGVPGIGPVLWPDHCVQNTYGAEINERIEKKYGIAIIQKGTNPNIDSYSAFFENDKKTKTGLTDLLREKRIKNVYVCGLALDYCCFYTAMDAKSEGFNVFFIKNLTKGIDIPVKNIQNSLDSMTSAGIEIIEV
ncbi:MAG: bifunctional nicotinamidase/pyrazinamidase [Promethearchaeota archaeon]|nr:MAG: bifunctional nicotinamidase/pyrazinamidase [Candidatus Lokiarchaeota archaeon]